MFDFLKRQKLQRRGYSCGRKRREQNCSEWGEILRTSPYIRWLTLAAFLCALGILVKYLPAGSTFEMMPPGMGMACLLALLPLSLAHFKLNLRAEYDRNSRFFLVYALILVQLVLLQGVWVISRLNHWGGNLPMLLAPVALAPMTLTLLLGKRHGAFAVLYVSLWGALLADWQTALTFAVFSSGTGMVSVWAVRRLRKRSELMRAGLYSGLAGFVLAMFLLVLQQWMSDLPVQTRGLILADSWPTMAMECAATILSGIFTAMLVGGMLPVLEALFRVTTTISWIELADMNHPLLRRLTLEAPGTYHHSLMVANLSEAAAEAVGANATICRVCSYFHDIGKLVKPEYCIENITSEDNPHDDLTPSMSALVVMAHVKDGVDLACRHKLNREIIDVIQQHHGTSLVYYFYRRALELQEEAKKAVAEGRLPATDVPEVNPSSFRYPGPKPSFRESAIISLADAVESASRTLSKPTPQKIEALVDEIIRGRLRDGQLNECDLTVRELNLVRESFTKTLRTSLHRRVPYPEDKDSKADEPGTITERLDERDRTERLDRPRPSTKTGATRTVPPAATNIIPMPPAANERKDVPGKKP
ncbi:MAG TPA: HDIG domain-containing protein [Verrucomicrobiales bacterium]|nr:HDIG domain-containing protein [Verrucomicrobiales bacterium]